MNRGVVWKDQGVHPALPALPPCTPLVGLSGGLETWMGLRYTRLRALASRVRFFLSWNISYKFHFVRPTPADLQLLGGEDYSRVRWGGGGEQDGTTQLKRCPLQAKLSRCTPAAQPLTLRELTLGSDS